MADRVDASMQTMEPTALEPPANRATADPERCELPVRDHPVLSRGHSPDRALPLQTIGTHMVRNVCNVRDSPPCAASISARCASAGDRGLRQTTAACTTSAVAKSAIRWKLWSTAVKTSPALSAPGPLTRRM
jgi:hypothetical protein